MPGLDGPLIHGKPQIRPLGKLKAMKKSPGTQSSVISLMASIRDHNTSEQLIKEKIDGFITGKQAHSTRKGENIRHFLDGMRDMVNAFKDSPQFSNDPESLQAFDTLSRIIKAVIEEENPNEYPSQVKDGVFEYDASVTKEIKGLNTGMLRNITRGSTFGTKEERSLEGLRNRLNNEFGGPSDSYDRTKSLLKNHDLLQTRVNNGKITDSHVSLRLVKDNVMLDGHFYKPADWNPEEGGKVILLLSGSGGPSEMYSPAFVNGYADLNTPVLTVNYRGFGNSTGVPSEQGLYKDASIMFNYLTTPQDKGGLGIPADRVIIHGYSLGTPIAANLAERLGQDGINHAGTILDHPLASSKEIAKSQLGNTIQGKLAGKIVGTAFPLRTDRMAERSQTPILVITAENDEMKDQGVKIHEALNEKRGGNVPRIELTSKRVILPYAQQEQRMNGSHYETSLLFARHLNRNTNAVEDTPARTKISEFLNQ
ncbi:alpha/beta hydrolase [Thermoproteota archaeon]